MNEDFIKEVAQSIHFGQPELIEKDLIIHLLLSRLAENPFFYNNFLFKGGTCLVKCYLGYYRFSEDIDFTWENQSILSRTSALKRKKIVSGFIDNLLSLVGKIAKEQGLIFKQDKSDSEFVQFGGNEMRLTLKVHYNSQVLQTRSFVKIQINFTEEICFPPRPEEHMQTLVSQISEETKLLFPTDSNLFANPIKIKKYDINEIAAEKVRAILTRQGIKARDYTDLYMINRKYKIKLESLYEQIAKKINYAISRNKRYMESITAKKKELETGTLFQWGDEKKFLLVELDSNDFDEYVLDLEKELRKILNMKHIISRT